MTCRKKSISLFYLQLLCNFEIVSNKSQKQWCTSMHPARYKAIYKGQMGWRHPCSSICRLLCVKSLPRPSTSTCTLFLGSAHYFSVIPWSGSQHCSVEPSNSPQTLLLDFFSFLLHSIPQPPELTPHYRLSAFAKSYTWPRHSPDWNPWLTSLPLLRQKVPALEVLPYARHSPSFNISQVCPS